MFQEYSNKYNPLVERYNALLIENKKDQEAYNVLVDKYNALLRQNIKEEEDYNLLVQKYNALLVQNKNDQEAHLVHKQHAEAMKDGLRHENETLKKENADLRKMLLGD